MRAEDFVPGLLLVQIFVGDSMAWNAPAWSLAVEVWLYGLAALLLAFAGRLFWPALALLIAGAAAGLVADERYLVQLGGLTVLRGWYGFGLGMIVLALFRRRGAGAVLPFAIATAVEIALVAGGLLFVSLARNGGWVSMLAPPAFAVGVFVFAAQAGAVSRLLLAAPFRVLGLLSYSIYLTHTFVLDRLHDALEALDWPALARIGTHASGDRFVDAAPLVSDGLTVLLLAAVVAVSWLTFTCVERPARAWSRRLAGRGRAAGAAVAAAGP
jgi:peptidoglycan/LPS O-acetylase OafA/YrhL